jgi:Tol biopolymer transport system component
VIMDCSDSGENPLNLIPGAGLFDRDVFFLLGNQNSGKLYAVNADSSGFKQVKSFANETLEYFDISVDREKIVWNTPDRNGIYLMNYDGSNRRQLTAGHDWAPSISPDGKKVVFSRDTNKLSQICIMNLDSPVVRQLTQLSQRNGYYARFSPNSDKISFNIVVTENGALRIINTDGSNIKDITGPYARFNGNDLWPVFSPQGTSLVYHTFYWTGYNGFGNDIAVIDLNTFNITRLTFADQSDGDNTFPYWSPNGDRIVFVSNRNNKTPELFVMPSSGGSAFCLHVNKYGVEKIWSPIWRK